MLDLSDVGQKRSAKGKYLTILSAIYKDKEADFDVVIQSPHPIEASYISTSKAVFREPGPVHGSPYWAETNLSTPQKAIVAFRMLDKLQYDNNQIVQIIRMILY